MTANETSTSSDEYFFILSRIVAIFHRYIIFSLTAL
jgi:hypothetical protein